MKITFVGNFDVDYSSENHHAKTLEAMGHEVIRLREGKANSSDILLEAIQSELVIWVHTHGWETPIQDGYTISDLFSALKQRNIPTLTYHLDLWKGIARERDLENDPFYKSIEYFFTVDKLMADWFNENTEVKGRYIHAGVYEPEAYLADRTKQDGTEAAQRDVIFVGSRGYHPEWQYRPKLINWLKENYNNSFTHIGGDGEIPTTRGDALNQLYADSKVVIGDSLCINYLYPHYWSDRVYETLGRGGFLIHPYIQGMEEDFTDGQHLTFYKFGDFDDLKTKIEYYLDNPDDRERIRKAGHEHVKANHTYTQRWQTILKEIGL